MNSCKLLIRFLAKVGNYYDKKYANKDGNFVSNIRSGSY